MSLGVLNNLSAVYAENNLTNTNNQLSKTLQQLSSGSRINSGADDAAGLSLVDGLQANQQALNQSETNASEGVGLLQVADGALSQVTSLLNRAVTLATEVSNGTLNDSQDAAANQEYQSILSEINNIGSTTTYNQNQVFTGSAAGVQIYTGDSSTGGASADDLYFASLTSSTVGDSGGSVVQSNAGEFIDLADTAAGVLTKQAAVTDNVAGGLKFTITNPDSTTTNFTTTAGTVSGLIAEINEDGIPGVSASLTTAGAAGFTTNGGTNNAADVGIMITNTNSKVAIAEGATALSDSTTAGTGAALQTSTKGLSTISYQAGANEHETNLAKTDLTTQGDAENALTQLNSAIADVAAQDGYIGAQINTLNAVSQVVSTQQENVQAAQNAVQATDYAQASSNMSKYEILSQTGIAALAQANSQQQDVLKLLQ
jgi:flagellin